MSSSAIQYLIFDTESVADGALVARLRYGNDSLSPAEAIARYRSELLTKYETDFIPYTFQVPVAVAVGKVAADFELLDIVSLDEPQFRPHVITENFWRGWDRYRRPTLVSFNGRGFDLPLLELAAFRYGLSVPGWFEMGKQFEQPRYRYNVQSHLDLLELLNNFGSSRLTGGLHLAANLLGKPGKMEVQGHMVQDLYDQGRLTEINDYCRYDVLDTYFVFLRTRVLVGQLSIEREQEIIAQTRNWLEQRAQQSPAYGLYLEHWGDWENPWAANAEASDAS